MVGDRNEERFLKEILQRTELWGGIMRMGEEMNTKEDRSRNIVTVTLHTCIREVLGLNFGRTSAILTKVFGSFPQSLQTNTRRVCPIGHNFLLPNSFHFINHPII
jgi:hypothetical protein